MTNLPSSALLIILTRPRPRCSRPARPAPEHAAATARSITNHLHPRHAQSAGASQTRYIYPAAWGARPGYLIMLTLTVVDGSPVARLRNHRGSRLPNHQHQPPWAPRQVHQQHLFMYCYFRLRPPLLPGPQAQPRSHAAATAAGSGAGAWTRIWVATAGPPSRGATCE